MTVRDVKKAAQAGGEEFAPAPPDQTYQHALVRRLMAANPPPGEKPHFTLTPNTFKYS